MAASLSRPDVSSPASVSEAGFSTARRGFSQDEVRAFLRTVANELTRLQERERQLEARVRDLESTTPDPVVLDDDTVTQLLGEETLRVLHTARESASQIKVRAEETAARVLREASEDANRIRQEAELEAARRRQDAVTDAEHEVALAKQQGREMVNEARAYRERVLADLERRTQLARQQIDELTQGRDRLLQVFERARLVAVDVTSDLRSHAAAATETVNLSPTTGPVPILVAGERDLPRIQVTDDDVNERTDAVGDDLDAMPADPHDPAETDPAETDAAETEAAETEAAETVDAPVAAGGDRDDNVVSLFARLRGEVSPVEPTPEPDAVEPVGPESAATDVDVATEATAATAATVVTEVTAAGDVAGDAADGGEPVEPTAFTRRDEALVPVIVAGARKLKRVLADEQNGVLDTLRQRDPVTQVGTLVGDDDAHVNRYLDAISDELLTAAATGAIELGAADTKSLRRALQQAGALDTARGLLRSHLVGPLRERLDRSVAEGAGDNDDVTRRVRAVYREWKTQRIDDVLDDVFRFAHGGGMAATAEPGTPMAWTIDPSEPACPDCEDNSLAGPVGAGDAYPTGHSWAPAHPGCRCLTLPVGQ